jgi:hypothetical protein
VVVFGRNQKLLPPIVLGTGAILLNAADKDDQVELSKIVPSKFGDSDLKLRTSLDVGEVLLRAANLGATYPEIVSILESADRQKNLPGPLVVDAVPTASADYFQAAILGKDSTAKADPAVKRAAEKGSTSRLRRMLGLASRKPVETIAKKADDARGSTNSATAVTSDSTKSSAGATGSGSDAAGSGSDVASGANPKKDDGVQRATAETQSPAPPRSRLLDWFRRRSD